MGEAPVAVPEVATLALAGDDTYTPARDGTVIATQANRRAEAFETFILTSPAKNSSWLLSFKQTAKLSRILCL